MTENPKLAGSNIVDCVPQTGECPMNCAECYGANGGFWHPTDRSLLPSTAEVGERIVRVNSYNDSNNDHPHVVTTTKRYARKFFNTSKPSFAFNAPVVFTCNGREPLFVACPPNVMMVRVRYTMWDLHVQDELVEHYLHQHVPVVLTWMRFGSLDAIPPQERQHYEHRRHLLHDYWQLTATSKVLQMERFAGTGVRCCGLPWSSLCVDCGNCEAAYFTTMRRLDGPDA